MWIFNLLLFEILCPWLVLSQYTGPVIDAQLSQINSGLIAEELKLSQLMSNVISLISQTTTNLQTQNKTMTALQQQIMTNLYTSLQDLATLLTDLSTLSNYWSYNSILTCDDANQKETEIDFNIRYFKEMGAKVWSNNTKLTVQNNLVSYYAFFAYSTLIYNYNNGATQQQQVAQVISNTTSVILEFNNYYFMLSKAVYNESVINTYLSLFKNQYCKCPSNFSSAGSVNLTTLETNVQTVEQPLVSLEALVISAANAALTNANTAVGTFASNTALWLVTNINRVITFLTNLATTNTYYNITWNSVNACSDLKVRTSFISLKYRQYNQAWFASLSNTTAAYSLHGSLNITAALYKLTSDQSLAIAALIGSLKVLEPLMSNYSAQLSYSAGKMMRIYLDMMLLGDTYCSCTTTSTTTSTTVPTTPSPNIACALWITYYLDAAPTVNGFSAGKSLKGYDAWVARAAVGTYFIPGRVQVEATTGFYVDYLRLEMMKTAEIEYLVVPSGCICAWKDPTTANSSIGLVHSPDPKYSYVIGRVTFSSGLVQISKVQSATYMQTYIDDTGKEQTNAATEILVCESSVNTAVQPTITFANAACAVWRTYILDSSPIYNGFLVNGLSILNTTFYVGRGWYGNQHNPGRLEIGVGVYVTRTSEQKIVSEIDYLVVTKGCSCSWTDPYTAIAMKGMILVADYNFHWAVGKKTLSTGQISIAKINTQSLENRYIDENNIEQIDMLPEAILVCQNSKTWP
ncbi:hypothetical protein PVAND_015114 [Polypedilum vanderplanki]|uniref:Uncharacterized protein n=1 Tax=Polypedilum vanderplanki TaxID=319348 RepID=A0A9J6BC36_POLVA|nr:hypothetical protein PVAND_015114 [Polypedilum vanderplanki]